MRVRLTQVGKEVARAGAFCLVDVTLFSHVLDPQKAPSASRVPTALVIAYAIGGFAALAWLRRYPIWALVVMALHSVAASGLPLLGYTPTVGPFVALYGVAVSRGQALSLLALGISLVPSGWAVADAVRLAPPGGGTERLVVNSVFYLVVGIAVWGVGRWVRASRAQARNLEYRRQVAAQEAVAAERARLAHELHDIVTHSVTVMVLQAGGAQQVISRDTVRARQALAQIEELGKQAMGELRRLLVVLESRDGESALDEAPLPGLDNLDDLLRTFRAAGMSVRLEVKGRRGHLDRSVDLAAYRVVQEALTNVSRHAGPGARTTLTLSWDTHLQIDVVDDGHGRPDQRGGRLSSGHGLLGLQERVSVVGGHFHAGPRTDGGFEVTAVLPCTSASPAGTTPDMTGTETAGGATSVNPEAGTESHRPGSGP